MFVLIFAGAAFYGWFRPSDFSECLTQYAAVAATPKLVAFTRQACASAFQSDEHPILRQRALCEASALATAKADYAATAIREACFDRYPDPSCASGQQFNYEVRACERKCTADQKLNRSTNSCEWACMPGWIGDPQTGQCEQIVDPFKQTYAQPPPTIIHDGSPGQSATPTIIYDGSRDRPARAAKSGPKCEYQSAMSDAEIAACRGR